jgi:hypothetical protein
MARRFLMELSSLTLSKLYFDDPNLRWFRVRFWSCSLVLLFSRQRPTATLQILGRAHIDKADLASLGPGMAFFRNERGLGVGVGRLGLLVQQQRKEATRDLS